ncbi:MAG: S1C family serine protease [Nitrospinota bacterium]
MNFCSFKQTFFSTPRRLASLTAGCFRPYSSEEAINIKIYKQVSPAVVNVTPIVKGKLKRILGKTPASGTVIDRKGTIVTNFHVVEKSDYVNVTLYDGSVWRGSVTGKDPSNDLALIRVNAPRQKLHFVSLGNSDKLEVGTKVLAIGNPFGLTGTLTTGIVSSVGRSIKGKNGRFIQDVIQTDASINPGNSGGPLLNSKGEMVGMNTALLSHTGGNTGIGFSISVNAIKKVLPELLSRGYVVRPWVGILGRFIDSELAAELGLASPGILISDALPKSPAEKAGVRGGKEIVNIGSVLIAKGGDLLISFDNQPATSMEKLNRYVETKKIGEKLRLSVIRDRKVLEIETTLIEEPVAR